MRRFLLALILLLGLACGLFVLPNPPSPVRDTATAMPTATLTPSATATLTPQASPTLFPSPTVYVPAGPGLEPSNVHLFPQPLFVGDLVSVDVDPRLPDNITSPLTLTLTLSDGDVLTTTVEPVGLDAQFQARFYWAWEASSTAFEPITFTLVLPPDVPDSNLADNVLVVSVVARPPGAFLPPEPTTRWASTDTAGFRLHYLTSTAAERDLPEIIAVAEAAYADVTAYFDPLGSPVDIYLLDRVIGQGGYASSDWVAISYTDRQYTPVNLDLVLRHELTHRLDVGVGCQDVPSMLREGLAVYVSGGHYWEASIARKAAVIRASQFYIPLEQLVEDFYTHQHEVSYMEAGALITYIVDAYGRAGLGALCEAISDSDVEGDYEHLNAGLTAIGAGSLPDFAIAWDGWLTSESVSDADLVKLDAELHVLDTMRAYQLAYDMGAHFLEGILFSPEEGMRRDIAADFVRRRRDADAISLELMLVMAHDALRRDAIDDVGVLLNEIDSVLAFGFPNTGFPADIRAIVATSLAKDYEPFRATARDDGSYELHALTYSTWPELNVFEAVLDGNGWVLREAVVVE